MIAKQRPIVWLFVFITSVFLSACSQTTTIHPDDPDKLTDQFVYLALGVEPFLNEAPEKKVNLSKWTKPLRVRLFAAANVDSTSLALEMDSLSGQFERLLGRLKLEYEIVRDDSWNFAYFFYSDAEDLLEIRDAFKEKNTNDRFKSLVRVLDLVHGSQILESGKGCLVNTYASNDETNKELFGSHTYAFIFLPTYGSLDLRKACFMEESAQALGMLNDYGLKRPHYLTIFDDTNDGYQLTPADILVLEALYDDRITPGMDETELRQVLPAIFREILIRESLIAGS